MESTSQPSDPDQATTEKIKDCDSETEASGQLVCDELKTEVIFSEVGAPASIRFSVTRDEKTLFSENCKDLKQIPDVDKPKKGCGVTLMTAQQSMNNISTTR